MSGNTSKTLNVHQKGIGNISTPSEQKKNPLILEYENIIASNTSVPSEQDRTSITPFEEMGNSFLESSRSYFLAQPSQNFKIDQKQGFRCKKGNFRVWNPVIVLSTILRLNKPSLRK